MRVCLVAGAQVPSVSSIPHTLPSSSALWSINGHNYLIASDEHVQLLPLGKPLSNVEVKALQAILSTGKEVFLELAFQRADAVLLAPEPAPKIDTYQPPSPVVAAGATQSKARVSRKPKPEKATTPTPDRRKRQPGAPKKSMNAYMHYLAARRAEVKVGSEKLPPGAVRKIAEAWRGMSAEARAPYIALEVADRERYKREMDAYATRSTTKPVEVSTTSTPPPAIPASDIESPASPTSGLESPTTSAPTLGLELPTTSTPTLGLESPTAPAPVIPLQSSPSSSSSPSYSSSSSVSSSSESNSD